MTTPRLPKRMRSAAAAQRPLRLEAEVVVVGLGAGGGMAFHDLAIAGVDVLGVEVGSHFEPQDMELLEETMMPRLFAEAGARATDDFAISIMQGRGVGGSTLHNTNLCKRLPREILEEWEHDFGVEGLLGDELQQDFADVERLLNVHPVPDDRVNPNNRVLQRGINALGYAGGRLSYNRNGCKQSGYCELGCPNNGKQNVSKVLVPPALEACGRILTNARVDTIVTKGKGATGVRGVAVDPDTGRDTASFEIHASHVVLAASATASAAIVQRSALPDPHALAGSRLHVHPGAIVMGIFDKPGDEPIEGWKGVPQSVECTEFLEFGPRAKNRAWLVSGFTHPGAAAGFMPGFGAAHSRMMRLYPRVAAVIVMLHDISSGRVAPGSGEKVHISYRVGSDDLEQLALGMREAGKLLLAAGASEVVLPLSPARRARTTADLARISGRDLGPHNPALAAVHPMSTLWMGEDPRHSVVTSDGAHHHVRGLHVADGSLFPTSIGGPPQIPIYTFGRRVARHVLAQIR